MKVRELFAVLLLLCATLILSIGCDFDGAGNPLTNNEPRSETPPASDDVAAPAPSIDPDAPDPAGPSTAPVPSSRQLRELVNGNSEFAFDLYHQIGEHSGNLIFSPYSISLAFAMAYAGATGETEFQLNRVLRAPSSGTQFHQAFAALDDAVGLADPSTQDSAGGFELNIANSLWMQDGFQIFEEFISFLEQHYRARPFLVDFENNTESARLRINAWVEEKTKDLIKDLIPAGAIGRLTRLVLVNAIYFKGAWEIPFREGVTQTERFHALDGSEAYAELMQVTGRYNYMEGDGYKAIELPYQSSRQHMLAIVPDRGQFSAIEARFSPSLITRVDQDLRDVLVELRFPRFKFESDFGLGDAIMKLGAPNAFARDQAEFAAINGKSCKSEERDCLYISEAIHKAVIEVDEEGTEAAAATAIVMSVPESGSFQPPRPIILRVDRPFLFLIRDDATGSILFAGRMENPR